jgi:hypothetical protein
VPYVTDLTCGDVRQPVSCLVGCFLLIALGLWAVMNIGFRQRLRAVMFGVTLVVIAFPVVVFSGAWITCTVGDYGPPSAGMAPLTQASLRL